MCAPCPPGLLANAAKTACEGTGGWDGAKSTWLCCTHITPSFGFRFGPSASSMLMPRVRCPS